MRHGSHFGSQSVSPEPQWESVQLGGQVQILPFSLNHSSARGISAVPAEACVDLGSQVGERRVSFQVPGETSERVAGHFVDGLVGGAVEVDDVLDRLERLRCGAVDVFLSGGDPALVELLAALRHFLVRSLTIAVSSCTHSSQSTQSTEVRYAHDGRRIWQHSHGDGVREIQRTSTSGSVGVPWRWITDAVSDGQSLAECTFESTARNVGMMSPDLPLMRGTLRRNLTYRYGQASDDLLQQAILSCRIDELLDSVDGGLSEWVIEGGTNLATGHRQRICLARATLGNPRILLLDEPTTNLDAATKEVFRRVISRYNGTIMLVTHDPVEASLADHVVIMDSGQIARHMTGEEFRAEMTLERRMEAGRPKW